MKALVGALNKEKALVGAFCGTVQLHEGLLTALIIYLADHRWDIVILPLIGGMAADFFWELDKSFILSEPATLIN